MKSSSPYYHKAYYLVGVTVVLLLIGYDLASTLSRPTSILAIPVSQLKMDGVEADYTTQTAIVRSDESFMIAPKPLDEELSREEIIEMTYHVLDLSGDLRALLFEGARVTIKVNVVELADLGNGVNTDPRVVEGLIRWMEDYGPGDLHYTVAEGGGGWLGEQWSKTKYNSGGAPVGDGFKRAGYRDMQYRLARGGIQVTIVDTDFGTLEDPLQGIRLVPVPEYIDFPEHDSYWVNEAFLDTDVLIDVPVMKIHTPQITVCLKNYIGIAAGAKYGTYKGMGGPDPCDPVGLHQQWPDRNSVEREIIDLASIAPADYCLVDAIVCKERAKNAGAPSLRRNMLIAGTDMVAVDTVCARLMGLNPDDVPHLCDAAREGLGTMDVNCISILGEHSLDESMFYFERCTEGDQANRGHFGMNNRVWLLNAAPGSDIDTPYLGIPDEQVIGTPGSDGWTEPILFSDDYIDFEAYYGDSDNMVYYAFAWITVPEEQDAELWISHDESCAVWIGGEEVYHSNKFYQKPGLPGGPTQTIHLQEGRYPILIKLVDTVQNSVFVMNICRILPSTLPEGKARHTDLGIQSNKKRYEGTRVMGLTFDTGATDTMPESQDINELDRAH